MIAITSAPQGLFQFSGNEIRYTVSVSNLCAWVEVDVVDKATNLLIDTKRKRPTSNAAAFDVSASIDAFLNSNRESPAFTNIPRATHTDAAKDFYVTFREINAFSVVTSTVTAEVFCLRGVTDVELNYFAGFVSQGQILSFAPTPIEISNTGVARFDWLNFAQKSVKVLAQFKLINGAIYTTTLHTEANAARGAWHFAFGYNALRIAATADFWTVDLWLRDASNNNLSSLVRFEMREQTALDRWLIFANSVGGWDTILVSGKSQEKVSYDRSTGINDAFVRNLRTAKTQVFSLNMGFAAEKWLISDSAQNWIAHELLMSKMMFLQTPKKVIEVRATSREFVAFEDENYTQQLIVELEAVRIAESFTTATIAMPPTYVPGQEGYYETGFINDGYFE